jgi:hypothetical protein
MRLTPVAHGVVHLPRDPGALGQDGVLRQQFPLRLGAFGPRLEGVHQIGPGSQVGADRAGQQDDEGHCGEGAERVVQVGGQPQPGDRHGSGDRSGDPHRPAAAVPAHGIRGDR